jgi:fatty acid desaturase
MIMRNPVTWRWSHARHHSDTVIVGRDPEIAVMRPPDLLRVVLNFVGIIDVWHALSDMMRNAAGNLSPAEESFIPARELQKVVRTARIWLAIYVATVSACVLTGSIIPLMLIGLPRMYGAWHHVMVGLLQHGGLADNVLDHRLNARSVLMNPVSRFIYWNMNYHVEHHMFAAVPYHALPRLHELIKHDLPAPSPSIWAAYKEMVPAFIRQLRYEDYFVGRELPPTARPYRDELHAAQVEALVAAE